MRIFCTTELSGHVKPRLTNQNDIFELRKLLIDSDLSYHDHSVVDLFIDI